jgi:hypothetical protein
MAVRAENLAAINCLTICNHILEEVRKTKAFQAAPEAHCSKFLIGKTYLVSGRDSIRVLLHSVSLTVYRLGSRTGAVTVDFATSDGLAQAGIDYTSVTGTFSWGANDVSPRTITVPLPYTNSILKAARQFLVSLSNPTGGAMLGTADAALVMVVNPVVNAAVLSAPTYVVPKATTNAVITINRLGNGNGPLTVYFSTRSGTATAGTDYTAINPFNPIGSTLYPVIWADGDLSPKTAWVQIFNTGSTGNKTFAVALNDGSAPRIAGSSAPYYLRSGVVILATNTTPSPGILAFSGYAAEVLASYGDSGAAYMVAGTNGSATLQVSRTYGSSGAVSITYQTTVAGTAAQNVDYTPVSGTLSWADGDTTNKTFTVPIINNAAETGNLSLWTQLTNPTGGAILGMPYAAMLTIVESKQSVVTPPNLIVQQPNETVTVGQSATFSVVASGTGLTYQWQRDGTNIVGATNATYTITATQPADAGTYTVVVRNSAGTATSTGALLTVNPFQITHLAIQSNDVLITWSAAGGQTNVVQATADFAKDFTNITANMFINGTGAISTNFLELGAATNWPARFYRVLQLP